MKRLAALALVLGALVAIAGDQGKPGTQGAWPVRITSGGWTPDGGFIGTAVLDQGPSADGGSAWVVDGTIIPASPDWSLWASFDLAAWLASGNTLTAFTPGYTIGFSIPYDGGTTLEMGRTSASNPYTTPPLQIRSIDSEAYALMIGFQYSNCTGAVQINLYVYGTSNGFEDARDGGATSPVPLVTYTSTAGSASGGGGLAAFGVGASFNNITPMFTQPVWAGAITAVVVASTSSSVTSCSNALVQIWRKQ